MTLSRPHVHNAFNDKVVLEMSAVVEHVKATPTARGLFVRSTGKIFCAGGDLNYMKEMAEASEERNLKDAVALSRFLNAMSRLPVPTIALVQGSAFGGGVGLISVCDIAVAVRSATFALSEVKLGLIPATISPYVVRRIGANHARRYFQTAEKFDAERALSVGLVHEVVDKPEDLETWATNLRATLKQNAPSAVAASKALVEACVRTPVVDDGLIHDTAQRLAAQRSSAEGKEGVKAFLEKRPAKWAA